ncbi:MAG: asparagine synthetase A [Acidobacteriota bacterium]
MKEEKIKEKTDKIYEFLSSEKIKNAVKVQSEIIRSAGEFLRKEGFIEIFPVIISPITDPLADPNVKISFSLYGYPYQITKSMIFHKQISLLSLEKMFTFSPNLRIEPEEKKDSGKHLFEFTQLDLEVRNARREEILSLGERLLVHIIKSVKESSKKELDFFRRKLKIPKTPFGKVKFKDVYQKYQKNYEDLLSRELGEPVWLIDFPIEIREFYDREDKSQPGYLVDMDLIFPEGYGEALSGGEREFEYEKILKRIQRKNIDLSYFSFYLEIAKKGLYPSAGFGIGIERLTRYICGIERIEETKLFPKIPGEFSL